MILTCPKCASRFNLLAEILAPDGKRVKCSNCGEVWFQLPDPDELLTEIEEQEEQGAPPLEDIPDAVKPIPEGSSVPAISDHQEESVKEPQNIVVTILSAFLMFLLLAMPLIAFKSSVMRAFPETMAFYNVLGMVGDLPGDGIIFDQMRAEIKDNTFVLSGQLINLTSKDAQIPLIEVTLKDKNGDISSRHYIRAPKQILKAEETFPITAQYEVKNVSALQDASIRFVLRAKN